MLSEIQPVQAGIEAGWNPGDPVDNRLRATLLSAAGTLCSSEFVSESADGKKPNQGKLAARRASASRKFLRSAGKAFRKGKTITYTGDPAEVISGEVDAVVDTYTARSKPGP